MLTPASQTSRSIATRLLRPQRLLARSPSRSRTLITPTATRQADLVRDLYLNELRRYKPAPIKPSDAEAHVSKFSAPKPPPSPEEGNIANDLKAYEEQQVEVEGQGTAAEAEAVASLEEEDWFEDDEDEDEHGPKTVSPSGH